ncbi:MAG: hypothetical protein HC865_25025 [Cyanobacteria bacterium RU_5_0]|nr:hypothetical protein [Cyanobacteria bacterium RU_5_0]
MIDSFHVGDERSGRAREHHHRNRGQVDNNVNMELANRFQCCFNESLEVLCQTFRTADRLLRYNPTVYHQRFTYYERCYVR